MKRLIACASLLAALAAEAALPIEGLTDENWLAGPKITIRDVVGKAVVLYFFSPGEEMSDRCIKRCEELYEAHDKKRFTVIGSVNDKIDAEKMAKYVADNKIKFPIYTGLVATAGESKYESGVMVLVTHRGKVNLTSRFGAAWQDFETALVEDITSVGQPPDLLPGVTLSKYKSIKSKLKFGTNLKSTIAGLEKEVKAFEKVKKPTKVQEDKHAEALDILRAIEEGKKNILEEIEADAEFNPAEAIRLINGFMKSFPAEAGDLKAKIPELQAKVKELKEAEKAAKAAAKGAKAAPAAKAEEAK